MSVKVTKWEKDGQPFGDNNNLQTVLCSFSNGESGVSYQGVKFVDNISVGDDVEAENKGLNKKGDSKFHVKKVTTESSQPTPKSYSSGASENGVNARAALERATDLANAKNGGDVSTVLTDADKMFNWLKEKC